MAKPPSHRTPSLASRSPAERSAGRSLIVVLGTVLVVAVTTLVVYAPALSARAISFDDSQYLTENRLVQDPSWESAWRFIKEVRNPSTVRGYYQPLAMISLMLDTAMGGNVDNLRPYHRTSLLLHAINAALIAVLIWQVFHVPMAALLVGLLFGVHPLFVEPVPWIGERKTLLASVFALLAIVTYVRYAQTNRLWGYGLALVAYPLAMLAKPTSVPLPAALLLMDYWPLRRLGKRAILEKIPLFVIGGLFAIITVISQSARAGVITPVERSPMAVPLVICHNIVFYLMKFFWPSPLSSHYPLPHPLDLSQPMLVVGVVGTLILLALLLVSWRWTRSILVGWLIFFVMIFPTLGVLQFTRVIAADKYAYLPAVGWMLTIGWAISRLWQRGAVARGGVLGVMAVVLGLCVWRTRVQLRYWQDSITYCRHMLQVAPDAPIVHQGMGLALSDAGDYEQAIAHLRRAVQGLPGDVDARLELAVALEKAKHTQEALAEYDWLVTHAPSYAKGQNNYANLLLTRGRVDAAIDHFQKAIALQPDYANAHFNLANAYRAKGDLPSAVEQYRRAIDCHGRFVEAWSNLGTTLLELRRTDEAIAALREAIRLAPTDASARINLGNAYYAAKRIDDAIATYQTAVTLAPKDADAWLGLAVLYEAKGDKTMARQHAQHAFRLAPGNPQARQLLERLGSGQ